MHQGCESFADGLALRQELFVLRLHLGQDTQLLVLTGKLRPHEWPQGRVLDLVMVMELILNEGPVRTELARSELIHSRCPQRGAQPLEIPPERLMDHVDDGEPASRRPSLGRRLLLVLHRYLTF